MNPVDFGPPAKPREIFGVWVVASATIGAVSFFQSNPGPAQWTALFSGFGALATAVLAYAALDAANTWRRQVDRPQAQKLAWELRDALMSAWPKFNYVATERWHDTKSRHGLISAFDTEKRRLLQALQRAELSFPDHADLIRHHRLRLGQSAMELTMNSTPYDPDFDNDWTEDTDEEQKEKERLEGQKALMGDISGRLWELLELADSFVKLDV